MDFSFLGYLPEWIKTMISLRANGITIDCAIEKSKTIGQYHLTLFVFPGRKETLFTSLKIPNCEISLADWDLPEGPFFGYTYQPVGGFRKELLNISILRPSLRIEPSPIEAHFIIKPIRPTKEIEVSLSYGGWFQTVSSKHFLV